ncbi:hypothetical protein KAU92_04695, partial [Candidatus Bathyarchaeota archaeon]|nr:hypothetical protein [Candidatus Bathyarchaeota archaeon]
KWKTRTRALRIFNDTRTICLTSLNHLAILNLMAPTFTPRVIASLLAFFSKTTLQKSRIQTRARTKGLFAHAIALPMKKLGLFVFVWLICCVRNVGFLVM